MNLKMNSEYDLIGHQIIIKKSKNKEIEGITGKVVYESKNMITMYTKNGEKDIPKDICTFSNKDGIIQSDATKMKKRPHERLEMSI
tara:strand:+ start:222 stop:479 length:258 start_codon:yes stop_codon:yes gene_type:complete